MSLLTDAMTAFKPMTETQVADGEGGFTTTWAEGTSFQAAITLDTSMAARIAEHDGITAVYTVTTAKTTTLAFHEVIKRVSDGKIFRITGRDKDTPASAGLNMRQVSAEEWKLT